MGGAHKSVSSVICFIKVVMVSSTLDSKYCKTGVYYTSKHLSIGVEGGLLVKALDCGSKGPGFQSDLQQRFISLLGALSPTAKIE